MDERSVRSLVHELNNLLAVCSVHSEVALEVDTREAMRRALTEIQAATKEISGTFLDYRAALSAQPETSQDTPESPSET